MANELERSDQKHTLELESTNRDMQLSQEALQASEQSVKTLIDWLPQAIVIHREGTVVYVNRSAVELVGAAAAVDLLGKPILELIHADSHHFVLERLKNPAGHGVPSPVAEVALIKLDGARVDAQIQGAPISYHGQPARLASIWDTTASKQAEDALRKNKARLRGIFESATDAIITADETQTIVTANPAAAKMFRCAVDDMVGAPLERFMPERFREGHRRDVHEFGEAAGSARQMGRSRDVIGLRGDGEEFPIDVSISHLSLDGRPTYTAILRDVTERRRIEGELREREATLQAALSSMSDAVFISDVHGRFVSINRAFATFHRFRTIEECRQTLAEYPEILDVLMANGKPAPLDQWAVSRALRGETANNVEYRLRRKDTGQSWVGSYNFAPIRSADGTIVGSVVTARDITDQKRAHAELESSRADLRRLIAAQDRIQDEERKRIALELHDDLQQTLAGIRIDLAHIGQRLIVDPVSVLPLVSEVDRLAQAAVLSTRRIVNDLRPQMLEDLGLVPALEVMCAQFMDRTGTACHLDASGDVGDALIESPSVATGLYRIAQEALNNVFKHAKATNVGVRLDQAGDGLIRLRVGDNGVGIRKRDKRNPESFGLLGMAERARSIGGHLRIEGLEDTGTVIEVLVPGVGSPAVSNPIAGDFAPTGEFSGPDELGRTAAEPKRHEDELGHLLQDVINALVGNVCVLDQVGTIVLVNHAWCEFAEHNGNVGLLGSGPGVNYLDVCHRSSASDPSVVPVMLGLSDVLAGRRASFTDEYPCDMPDGRHSFRMHAAAVTGGIAIVTHVDLTSRIDATPSVGASGNSS
jgi:PAS domain S-box-containing protein